MCWGILHAYHLRSWKYSLNVWGSDPNIMKHLSGRSGYVWDTATFSFWYWDLILLLSSGFPAPSSATLMSCWAQLGCWDEVDVGSRSRSIWGVNSISESCWSSYSSKSKMLDNEYVSAIGSKGVFIPLSASNISFGCDVTVYGMKWEKAYALEAWSTIPFAITSLV